MRLARSRAGQEPLVPGRYFYVAKRLEDMSLRIEHNDLPGWPGDDRPPKGFMSHVVFQVTDELGGRCAELTKLLAPMNADEFECAQAQRMRENGILLAHPFMIQHTDVDLIQPIMNHVEGLFSDLIGKPHAQSDPLALLD